MRLQNAWDATGDFDPDLHTREDMRVLSFELTLDVDLIPKISLEVPGVDLLDFLDDLDKRRMHFSLDGVHLATAWFDGVEGLGERKGNLVFMAARDQEQAMRDLAKGLRDAWATSPDTYYHRLFASENTLLDEDASEIQVDDLMAGRPFVTVWDPRTGTPSLVRMDGEPGEVVEVTPLEGSWSFSQKERPYSQAKLKLRCSYEQVYVVRCDLRTFVANLIPETFHQEASFFTTWDASQIHEAMPKPGREIGGGWGWERASWSHSSEWIEMSVQPPSGTDGEVGTPVDDGAGGSRTVVERAVIRFLLHRIGVPYGAGMTAALEYRQGRDEELDIRLSLDIDPKWNLKSPTDVLEVAEIEISDPTRVHGVPTWEPYHAYDAGDLVIYADAVWRCTQSHGEDEPEFEKLFFDDEGVAENTLAEAPSYLFSEAGALAVGHAFERVKKALLEASYAYQATFDVPSSSDPDAYSVGQRARVLHARLPDGEATGVVQSVRFSMDGTGARRTNITVAFPIGTANGDAFPDDGPAGWEQTTSGVRWRWPNGVAPVPYKPLDVLQMRNPAYAVANCEIGGFATAYNHPAAYGLGGGDNSADGTFSLRLTMREPPEHGAALLRSKPEAVAAGIFRGLN